MSQQTRETLIALGCILLGFVVVVLAYCDA